MLNALAKSIHARYAEVCFKFNITHSDKNCDMLRIFVEYVLMVNYES